jgi:hypothetical protein
MSFNQLFILFLVLQSVYSFASSAHKSISKPLVSIEKSKQVVVAVIDTGLDVEHQLIKNKVWRNQGEMGSDSQGRDRRFNKVDDDHNGFIDDFQGWNFIQNNNQVDDIHGHGTHVSGIILGADTLKKSSEDFDVVIMPLKYYDSNQDSEKTILNTARAIQYAVQMGADIINYSGGGYQKSDLEMAAIRLANTQKIPFIAAAGNDHFNADQIPFYPAAYPLSNIISVGSASDSKKIDLFSNFGLKNVHLLAPGNLILSSSPRNKMITMSGTSQSAAQVSHTVAMMIAMQKSRSGVWGFNKADDFVSNIKNRLYKTQPKNESLRKLASEAVLLNAQLILTQRNEFENAFDIEDELENISFAQEEDFLNESLLLGKD